MRRGTWCLVLALSGVWACGEAEAPEAPVITPPPVAPPSAPAEPAVPTPTPEAPAAAPAPDAITRAEVDTLLATWLAAQNGGDFETYAPLYAARFSGIRRTERAEFRLEHDGWIEDRRRLFGRPMEVEARDVEATLSGSTAIVHFTQRWSSGRYSEEGPKRMVLVREGRALRIASEELVSVSRGGAPAQSSVRTAQSTRSHVLVILGEAPGPGEGAPRDEPTEGMHVALRDVPAALAATLPTMPATFQLVGERGVCAGSFTQLAIAAFVVPHFGMEQEWQGEDFDDATTPVVTPPAQIAAAVDAMAEHHYFVAIGPPSTCGDAHAAVIGEQAPTVWRSTQRGETFAAVSAQLFRGATLASLITELREGTASGGEEGDEGGEAVATDDASLEAALRSALVVHEWTDGADAGVVEARIAIPGECGGHERVFLFARRGSALTQRTLDGWHAVESVIDLEGDGTPELVVSDDFARVHRVLRTTGTPAVLAESAISNFDCGC